MSISHMIEEEFWQNRDLAFEFTYYYFVWEFSKYLEPFRAEAALELELHVLGNRNFKGAFLGGGNIRSKIK